MMSKYGLDLTLCFGESLFDGDGLAVVESLLQRQAARWASDLHIYREGEKNPRRDIKDFSSDLRDASTERGDVYENLITKHGPGSVPRRTGTVELRGADDSLIVVISLDDYRFAPSAGRYLWGNTVAVQVCKRRVAGIDAVDFMRLFSVGACADLSPWYAHGHFPEEWNHKNISHEGGGTMAMGVDVSRYLPGLYWLNFFGRPYCALMGKERLLTAPAHKTKEIDSGVLLLLAADPKAWNTPEYSASEKRVLSHLGDQHFFNPREPQRGTIAPDFGLEPLHRNARFT